MAHRPSHCPWHRRKLAWAALALWLAVTYPLSLWPVAYGVGRGWYPAAPAWIPYAPLLFAADALRPHPGIGLGPPHEDGTRPYIVLPDPDPWPRPVASAAESYLDSVDWFADLGRRHAVAD